MKNLKDQKGITLVALVITIIVLLILAGVSLSLVVGDNGILGRASNSSAVQKAAAAREAVELDVANLAAQFYQEKYVDNKDVTTIGAFIASKRSAATALPGREDTYQVTVTTATSSAESDADKEYDVKLTVKNATGNGDGVYEGKIDANGKWIKPIALPTFGS